MLANNHIRIFKSVWQFDQNIFKESLPSIDSSKIIGGIALFDEIFIVLIA
jgi:hypothetical protein